MPDNFEWNELLAELERVAVRDGAFYSAVRDT